MKYDFGLDFVNNNSLTWIMDNIKTGTTVLEFGPATGRLTKYMKEDLGCKVYLVEIDEESGKKALQYAEDLVVGDAENYEWLEKYKDIRFDHIIFADVLEHLRNPEALLIQAKRLLKVDGSILLSVPNLAHNSVLINLLNNRFEYTSVGLLDNTHIHLFTKESLENMLIRAGLFVEQRYATYSKVGTNEIVNTTDDVFGIDKSYWLSRDYGEVYQFVYAVRKSQEYVTKESNVLQSQNRNYFAQIFFDLKNPNEQMTEKFYIEKRQGSQVFCIESDKLKECFRFDPLNGECFAKIRTVGATVISHNACMQKGEMYLFNTDDPIIELKKIENTPEKILIEVEYISIDTHVINDFSTIENQEHDKLVECLKKEKESIINSKETIINEIKNHNERLEQEIENLCEEIELLKQGNEQLNASIESWARLCHEKDRILDDIFHSKKWRLINFFRKR